MLHYVHKPACNCTCLLLGGEQVELCGFIELLLWKHTLEAAKNDIMSAPKMNHNS